MKTKIIPLNKIILDKDLYPRNDVDWMTVVRYLKAKQSGAKFPPIAVALFEGKYLAMDGFHRVDAFKKDKEKYIEAEVVEGLTKEEIFIESVKRNIGHGRQFSSQERATIILTLENWDLSLKAISEIIRIPVDEIKPFVAKRITRITETQEEIALKSPLKHLTEISLDDISAQQPLANRTQSQILDSLIVLVKNKWINLDSELIKEKLQKLYELLKLYYEDNIPKVE